MKTTFLQVGKKRVFLKLVQNPAYSLNLWLVQIFNVDQFAIQVYNNKDIKLFSQNLINISLESSRSIKKAKRHDLIFEISVLSLESCFLCIIFTNSHPIIGIDEIQLSKSSYSTNPIWQVANQRQQILVFNGDIVKTSIIHIKVKTSIWLPIKKNKYFGRRFEKSDEAVGQIDFNINF